MDLKEQYMERALKLAENGWGRTNPNPLVGAVIVKNGEIIGEGWHEKVGGPHAEIHALRAAKRDAVGATMYVTLEPCSHYGRTPPCADAIIKSGIKEVVIAMEDPNPSVSGRGIAMLQGAGIKVTNGVLEARAKRLNEIFIRYITKKRPFVIMKTAMTLDGKIASASGNSRWISGPSAREHVHRLRERVAAIMVGSKTVACDNPSLTARLKTSEGKNPLRIVVDSKGRIPLDSKVMDGTADTIIASTSALDAGKERKIAGAGARVLKLDGPGGHIDLNALMQALYGLGIDSVLLEGGGGLNAAALDAGIVDKVMIWIAPKIIGGKDAITPVEGRGIPLMRDALAVQGMHMDRLGDDILIEGYLKGELCLQEL